LNPVEALIFSGFFFPVAWIGGLTAMIVLRFHSTVLLHSNKLDPL